MNLLRSTIHCFQRVEMPVLLFPSVLVLLGHYSLLRYVHSRLWSDTD